MTRPPLVTLKVKGRKQNLSIVTLRLVLRVLVTADVPERRGGKQVLYKVKQMG